MKTRNIYNTQYPLNKDNAYNECTFENIDLSESFGQEEVAFGTCKLCNCTIPINAILVMCDLVNCSIHGSTIESMVSVALTNCKIIF